MRQDLCLLCERISNVDNALRIHGLSDLGPIPRRCHSRSSTFAVLKTLFVQPTMQHVECAAAKFGT